MLALTLVLLFVFAMGLAVAVKSAEPRVRSVTEPESGVSAAIPDRVDVGHGPRTYRASSAGVSGSVTVTVRGLYMRHSSGYWHWRYTARTRQYQQTRRALLARPSVSEAINLASVVYGYGPTLWRKARCESGLNPNARNGSEASGLFQFLPSTWATTPFAGFSIWSPTANALAAGWMHAHGRGGEWSCR